MTKMKRKSYYCSSFIYYLGLCTKGKLNNEKIAGEFVGKHANRMFIGTIDSEDLY